MAPPDIATAVPHAADFHAVPAASGVKPPIWPEAVVAFALGITVGWVILLGYGAVLLGSGLVRLIEHAI